MATGKLRADTGQRGMVCTILSGIALFSFSAQAQVSPETCGDQDSDLGTDCSLRELDGSRVIIDATQFSNIQVPDGDLGYPVSSRVRVVPVGEGTSRPGLRFEITDGAMDHDPCILGGDRINLTPIGYFVSAVDPAMQDIEVAELTLDADFFSAERGDTDVTGDVQIGLSENFSGVSAFFESFDPDGSSDILPFELSLEPPLNLLAVVVDVSSGTHLFTGAASPEDCGVKASIQFFEQRVSVTDVVPTVDLSITKSATPAQTAVGEIINYTIVVSNDAGPVDATQVTMTDVLPEEVTFVGATVVSGTGSCSDSLGTVTCDIGMLPAGASSEIDIEVMVNTAATFTNTATVQAQEPDTDGSNNSADATVEAVMADLDISDSIEPSDDRDLPFGLLLVGSERSETVTLTNNGTADVTIDAVAGDPLGDPFFIDDPATCFGQTLAPGASCTITIRYAPQASGDFADQFEITFGGLSAPVSVSGRAGDTMSDLVVENSADLILRAPGDTTTLTIVARNDGANDVPMVEVADLLPPQLLIPAGMTWFADRGSYDPDTGVWSLGELRSGEAATLTIPAELQEQSAECIVNEAEIRSTSAVFMDTVPGNNALAIGVNEGCTDLSLAIDAEVFETSATVTLSISNAGPDTAHDVVLNIILLEPIGGGAVPEPPQLPAGFSVGAGETETVEFEITGVESGDGADYELSVSTSNPEVTLDNNSVSGSATVPGEPADPPEDPPGGGSSGGGLALGWLLPAVLAGVALLRLRRRRPAMKESTLPV